jgi:hypothetical protein
MSKLKAHLCTIGFFLLCLSLCIGFAFLAHYHLYIAIGIFLGLVVFPYVTFLYKLVYSTFL